MPAASYIRPHPTSPVKFNGREWGAVAVQLVLTEGGLLMKMKTNLKAGQNNNFIGQNGALAAGGGGGSILQFVPAAANQNQ
jgi:hypothetical protein